MPVNIASKAIVIFIHEIISDKSSPAMRLDQIFMPPKIIGICNGNKIVVNNESLIEPSKAMLPKKEPITASPQSISRILPTIRKNPPFMFRFKKINIIKIKNSCIKNREIIPDIVFENHILSRDTGDIIRSSHTLSLPSISYNCLNINTLQNTEHTQKIEPVQIGSKDPRPLLARLKVKIITMPSKSPSMIPYFPKKRSFKSFFKIINNVDITPKFTRPLYGRSGARIC